MQIEIVDIPVEHRGDSLSALKNSCNTAGADPEDNLEYAYTATRFSLELHNKADSSPMTQPMCDDVDISE